PAPDGALDDVDLAVLATGVTVGAGQATLLGPPAIAVHHDRDVVRHLGRLQPRRTGAARVWLRIGVTATGGHGLTLVGPCPAAGHNGSVPTYRDDAVVLRTHKLGEADRIITLLTRRTGKVRAVARGIRRTSSKFGAKLEPFSHVDVQFVDGRSLAVITQAESVRVHGALLAGDFRRYSAGQVMLETADRLVAEEREPSVQQFLLLVGALNA